MLLAWCFMMLHDINGVTLLDHQDQEDLLPKLMKPKENWNETSEAVNKVWTKEWWDVFDKSTKLFHGKTFWEQQKTINFFYTTRWRPVYEKALRRSEERRSNLYLSEGWNIFMKWKEQSFFLSEACIEFIKWALLHPGLFLHRAFVYKFKATIQKWIEVETWDDRNNDIFEMNQTRDALFFRSLGLIGSL